MIVCFVPVTRSESCFRSLIFFFTDTATTEIYTLSLHDALPISVRNRSVGDRCLRYDRPDREGLPVVRRRRSEEHTSELQSRGHLVCRLLLEKKKKNTIRSSSQ